MLLQMLPGEFSDLVSLPSSHRTGASPPANRPPSNPSLPKRRILGWRGCAVKSPGCPTSKATFTPRVAILSRNIDSDAPGPKHEGTMQRRCGFVPLRAACFAAFLLVFLLQFLFRAANLGAQSTSFVVVSPSSATLLIGDSRSFRLVDQNGQMQRHVVWSISDPNAFQVQDGDEIIITAKETGEFRLSARGQDGSAEAAVKVMEGKMPVGTAIWSSGVAPGCKSTKLTQAMPSANGPDMYEQSVCPDGEYITAYTADGIQMWRRKLGGDVAPRPAAAEPEKDGVASARLNPRSSSVCDSISVGDRAQQIRDLLDQRGISFSEGAVGERQWTVEQSGARCQLWFDDKSVLTKKRKVFVTE
jgi:hypothetical protein